MNKPFTIQGTLVKDHTDNYSYNLTSKIDAERLYRRLNEYEQNNELNLNYKKLQQKITELQMDLKVVQADLDKIKELIK